MPRPCGAFFVSFDKGNSMAEKKYNSLKAFYAYYLSEHQDKVCRRLHFIGTGLTMVSLLVFLISLFSRPLWVFLIIAPFIGYGFAWIGHYFFERNKPATFSYPAYSLASDFILFFDTLKGKEKL